MKISSILFFCIIGLVFSCTNTEQKLKPEVKPKVKLWNNIPLPDSIPEKNSPEFLDLSKQQLFIDTSKNSQFYKEITDWNDFDYYAESFDYKDVKFSKIKLNKFPKVWIEIQKYNNEFIIFNPCDGNIRRFEIRDSLIFVLGTHEADYLSVISKIKESNSELIIKTRGIKNEISNFKIQKTKFQDIYILKSNSWGYQDTVLVVPLDKISKFNMMVNDSPNGKVIEFQGCCDEIDFTKF